MATVYWPFSVSTVSEWPGQRPGSYHVGTDFAVPQGTPLRATVDGTIVRHNTDGLGAYVLDIIADDGLLIRNGHLSRMDVNTGQRVTAGQIIGLTGGQPGTPGAGYSTGAHLHWELRRDRAWSGGAWIDPRNLNPQPLNFGQKPTTVDTKGNRKMLYINLPNAASDGKSPRYAFFAGNFWLEFEGEFAAAQFASQLQPGVQSLQVTKSFWDYCKAAATK